MDFWKLPKVTVGTTEFRDLITAIEDTGFVKLLSAEGINKMYVQYGTGQVIMKIWHDRKVINED